MQGRLRESSSYLAGSESRERSCISGGKQDGLEQMNAVKPGGCMSFSWSVSKMSYGIKETVCLLFNSEWSV